jgi:amino-acid N-acetyltransferase
MRAGTPRQKVEGGVNAVRRPLDVDIASRPTRAGAAQLLDAAGLPSFDLTDAMLEHFFFIGSASRPLGLVGLEVFGEVALLRSLVVAPGARSNGRGSALLTHAEHHSRSQGVRSLYLLTTTADRFFERHGFARIGRDAVPDSIRSTREFAEICPASSTIMVKPI